MKKSILVLLITAFTFNSIFAQDEIVGTWFNTAKDGKVEIYKSGEKFFGQIVWLKEPLDENTGKPKTDLNNPNDANHQDAIIGLKVLKNFEYKGNGVWENGKIYDPENGKTYSCKMTLKDNNQLDVRGYIGFSLLGRTENWTRAK
ncbi:MAG: DUF2147 domain-containing protein [Chitinophagales bacterium]